MKSLYLLDQGMQTVPRKSVPGANYLHAAIAVLEGAGNLRLSSDHISLGWTSGPSFEENLGHTSPCPLQQGSMSVFICRKMAKKPISLIGLSSPEIKTSPRSSLCNIQKSKFSLSLTSFLQLNNCFNTLIALQFQKLIPVTMAYESFSLIIC